MARPGRPRGETAQGRETRARLYETALAAFAEEGYQAATLRGIARAAGVSPALLYRYFPSKQALLLAFYDELSADFASRELPPGTWGERAGAALRASLATLRPHLSTLRALTPILAGASSEGIFGADTVFARRRVQGMFERAVLEARDAPPEAEALALGRQLYLAHLALILLWVLDKSPQQRASGAVVELLVGSSSILALAWALPFLKQSLLRLDAHLVEALGLA